MARGQRRAERLDDPGCARARGGRRRYRRRSPRPHASPATWETISRRPSASCRCGRSGPDQPTAPPSAPMGWMPCDRPADLSRNQQRGIAKRDEFRRGWRQRVADVATGGAPATLGSVAELARRGHRAVVIADPADRVEARRPGRSTPPRSAPISPAAAGSSGATQRGLTRLDAVLGERRPRRQPGRSGSGRWTSSWRAAGETHPARSCGPSAIGSSRRSAERPDPSTGPPSSRPASAPTTRPSMRRPTSPRMLDAAADGLARRADARSATRRSSTRWPRRPTRSPRHRGRRAGGDACAWRSARAAGDALDAPPRGAARTRAAARGAVGRPPRPRRRLVLPAPPGPRRGD